MRTPADIYLRLHDDGSATAAPSPARRIGALVLAILILAAVPMMWASADALGASAPKAALTLSDDDDNSGPGGDGDEDDDHGDTGNTATRSKDATNTGNTGVSTKAETATQSRDETRTKNTGVSTKGSR
jgi:hypothetical protein